MSRISIVPRSIARAVWNYLTVASRTVTVTTNNDKTGYTASTVSDKTGYSLTAGSYSIRASSVQRGTINISAGTSQPTNTLTISAVTTTRAPEAYAGVTCSAGSAASLDFMAYLQLTSTTAVTATRSVSSATQTIVGVVVPEYL